MDHMQDNEIIMSFSRPKEISSYSYLFIFVFRKNIFWCLLTFPVDFCGNQVNKDFIADMTEIPLNIWNYVIR